MRSSQEQSREVLSWLKNFRPRHSLNLIARCVSVLLRRVVILRKAWSYWLN